MTIDDEVLKVISHGVNGMADEWEIASSVYPWDGKEPEISFRSARRKHGAWIRVVVQAGCRLTDKGLVGSFIETHGLPGYNAPQSRIWCITPKGINYLDSLKLTEFAI
jgi:hypothetical protein